MSAWFVEKQADAENGLAPRPGPRLARYVGAVLGRGPNRHTKTGAEPSATRLFEPLKPVFFTLVCFGIVPAALTTGSGWRLSFHPLRSTLAWVLLVHTLGLLSVHRVLTSAAQSFGVGNLVASWSAFPAVLAVAHVSSYLIQVPIWLEARRYKQVAALATELERLMRALGMLDGAPWPSRGTSWRVKGVVALMVVYGPMTTALWQFWASGLDGEVYRIPAHTLANVMIGGVTGTSCLTHYIIRDAATTLTHRFARDVDRGLTRSEMAGYHGAWLALRALLEDSAFMPFSVSLCALLLVLNNLLCLYHVVNRVLSGAPGFRTLMLLALVPHVSLMFIAMCVAADAAVAAVEKFKLPLVKLEPTHARNAYIREVFREVLCYTPGSVCVAGFWYMNRRSATSVLCVTITYLIVLIEFRTDPNVPAVCNRTLESEY